MNLEVEISLPHAMEVYNFTSAQMDPRRSFRRYKAGFYSEQQRTKTTLALLGATYGRWSNPRSLCLDFGSCFRLGSTRR